MLSPRWKKVFADLWQNKGRTLLVVLSIAIGVFAFGGLFIARGVLAENLDTQYRERQAADITLQIAPHSDDLARWAERQPHVVAAQDLTAYALQMVANGRQFDLLLKSYDNFNDIRVSRLVPDRGVWPPERSELVIERSFLRRLGVALGDRVQIKVGEDQFYEVTLVGLVSDLTASGGSVNAQVRGFVTPQTLARMGLSAEHNRLDVAVVRDPFSLTTPPPVEIADMLRERLTFLGFAVRSVTIDADGQSWAVDILNGQTTIFTFIGLTSLLLSSALVGNIISGLLAQQRKQIGIMKLVGGTRWQIASTYLVMVFIFGALALAIALPLSLSFARQTANALGPFLLNFDIARFQVPLDALALQISLAFLVPLAAAIPPILNGTRITTAQAVSSASNTQTGLVETALSQIGGLPRPILLALRNTFRKKLRLVITTLTLALAGTLFMTIINTRAGLQIVIEEIVQLSNFDVQVGLTQNLDRRGLERRIAELPGAVMTEGWLGTSVRYVRADGVQSDNFPLTGLPPDSPFILPQPSAGRWLEPPTALNRNDLVVTRDFFERDPSLRIGSTITLRYAGEDEQWRIVGMIEGNDLLAYSYYDTVADFIGQPNNANRILIRTTDNSEAAHRAMVDEVTAYFDARDIPIASTSTGNTFRRDLGAAFDISSYTLLGTSLLIAVVAGLGLAGTMSLNVLERTREIGVMRSVGAGTGTIRLMYITEGFLVGILSFIIALPLVTPTTLLWNEVFGQITANRAIPFATSPVGPPVWLAIVIVVAILSSLSPAQRAAQISVREALSYE